MPISLLEYPFQLTADTSFVQDTVGAMQTYTVMEVLRNETLSVMKTEDGNQTILEYITSQLCPNNCSENGNCTKGKFWLVQIR